MPRSEQHQRKPPTILEAIGMAADAVGADGKGRGGRVGYFMTLAVRYPKEFAGLLGRTVAMQNAAADYEAETRARYAESRRYVEERLFGKSGPTSVEQ